MRKYLCLLAIILSSADVGAQLALGIATSDNNVINSLYLNPANVAGCKEKIVVNLFFVNLSADNNLGTITNLTNVFSNNPSKTFTKSGAVKDFSMMAPYGEIRGPSFLISSYGDFKSAFAVTTRVRIMNQLNHFSESIYNTVTDPSSAANQTILDTSTKFNWTAELWSELGVTYGLQLVDKKSSQLSVGFSFRYLGSHGLIALKGNNVNVSYKSGSDSFQAINSDLEYASNILTPNGAISNGINSSALLSGFFGTSAANGLGGDLGITYAYTFNSDKNGDDYDAEYDDGPQPRKLKFSAAVTDIGGIKYKEGYNSSVNVMGDGYITGTGLTQNTNNYTQFKNYVLAQGFAIDTSQKSIKVHLPTALILGADYNFYRHFYASATFLGNLVNRRQFGNSYYSQFGITPRYDTWLLTVAMPVTYSALAHEYKLGLGFRFSGFYFGSDDMLALVSNKQHGFGLYAGASVPIRKRSY